MRSRCVNDTVICFALLLLLGISCGCRATNGNINGEWAEACRVGISGSDIHTDEKIGLLIISPGGTFCVSRVVLETYCDYWGKYEVDAKRGTLKLYIEGAAVLPDRYDGDGGYTVTNDGELVIKDMNFGSFSKDVTDQTIVVKEYVFRRR